MTIYLGAPILERLDQAQVELERHLVTRPDGRCAACGQLEPCAERGHLHEVFAQYGKLPTRRRTGQLGPGTSPSLFS
jgi:hypothetical protein